MGEALLRGLIADGWAKAEELHVVDPLVSRRTALSVSIPELSLSDQPLPRTDAVLAVKPDVVHEVCSVLAQLEVQRVLSIVAGIRISTLESRFGDGVRVIRAMPNTPALIGKGAAAIAAGTIAESGDLNWASSILEAVGTVVVVDEVLIDSVTGLSGSGPAYLFLLAESLINAGCEAGLPLDISTELTEQTLLGAATLLASSNDLPSTLREKVTSKGGTTAAGLAVFEARGFNEIVRDVVIAATQRSRELGSE